MQAGFEGMAQDEKNLYLVMEFFQGGDLFTYIRSAVLLPIETARFYAATLVLALEYLHSKKIIFRDLKPESIYISLNGYLKLGDFSLAKVTKGKTYTLCGTPEYLAPEIILNKGHDQAVDWWAMGILLYEMLMGIDPFSAEESSEVYEKILSGKLSFPESFNRDAKSLIKRLLQSDLSKRLGNLRNGVQDIKQHKFFKGFSWTDCENRKMVPPYYPHFKSSDDLTNYPVYPESDHKTPSLKPTEDPFINWSTQLYTHRIKMHIIICISHQKHYANREAEPNFVKYPIK
eukprot:TRINITY_DN340_c1_g1_i1.p2 TRINITY_DN340_c1_g1~~TRINITY_DN340_c1_g1_i1.p2  ORF type:complete len:288 (+),score=17.28 TRINITY_DN340_c1_g1_i1:3288-4151(+)